MCLLGFNLRKARYNISRCHKILCGNIVHVYFSLSLCKSVWVYACLHDDWHWWIKMLLFFWLDAKKKSNKNITTKTKIVYYWQLVIHRLSLDLIALFLVGCKLISEFWVGEWEHDKRRKKNWIKTQNWHIFNTNMVWI